MTIYHLWNVEAGASEGVFETDTMSAALAEAHYEAVEVEGRMDFADEQIEIRELLAFPFDAHDWREVGPLVLKHRTA